MSDVEQLHGGDSGTSPSGPEQTRARFTAWVAPHWSAMALLAARLAEPGAGDDVLQDALLLAWRKWPAFDPVRGSPRTWLLTLVADQARKRRRARARRITASALSAGGDAVAQSGSSRDIDVERAIGALGRRQRVAVELFYFLGLPVADVAAVMRCAEGTVKSTLAGARTHLRDLLGEDFT